MASRAISGKPGGGKSYLATRWILKELLESNRPIITNVPLILPAIVKYCVAKGRSDIDVYNRILLLPWEETKCFWRYRGKPSDDWCQSNGIETDTDEWRAIGFVAPGVSQKDYKAGTRPAIETFPPGGVYYVLDELHEHLNSREWGETGMSVLYYLAKHRHLGDDIVWITQSCANVDKQWRSVTQDYTYCRNWSKEKWHGWAKGSGFQAVTYLDMVTGATEPPYSEKVDYKLERDVTACYKTSIVGQAADTGVKQKARSIKWVYAGIVAVALAVIALFVFGPKALTRIVVGKEKVTVSKPGASVAVAAPPTVKDAVLVLPVESAADVSYFEGMKTFYDATRRQVVVRGPSDKLKLLSAAFQSSSVVFWVRGVVRYASGDFYVVTDRGSFGVGDWCPNPPGRVDSISGDSIRIEGVNYPLRWISEGDPAQVAAPAESGQTPAPTSGL